MKTGESGGNSGLYITCFFFVFFFITDDVLPSLPGPSPSSIELQTFVDAKESEEPLCWDPWIEEIEVERERKTYRHSVTNWAVIWRPAIWAICVFQFKG